MNRRKLFGLVLAAPLALLGIRKSFTHGPDGSISIRINRPVRDGWQENEYVVSHRSIREYHRTPDGEKRLIREYGVMGTTGSQNVGDIITRCRHDAYLTGDYETRVTVGRVTRVATESEFMLLHPEYDVNRRKYPDVPTLFVFPNYYIVQTYPL